MLLKQAVMLALMHPYARLCSVLTWGIPSSKTVGKSISGMLFAEDLRGSNKQTRAGNQRWKMQLSLGG